MFDKFKEFIGIDDSYDDYDEDIENDEEEEIKKRLLLQQMSMILTLQKNHLMTYFSTYDNSYDNNFSSSNRKIRGRQYGKYDRCKFSTNSSNFKFLYKNL